MFLDPHGIYESKPRSMVINYIKVIKIVLLINDTIG